MKKENLLAISVLVVSMFASFTAFAEPSSGMDWKSGYISVSGTGVPPAKVTHLGKARAMACRAAKVDALRNLLEATQEVRVDSVTLVKDAMIESDLISTTVAGLVRGARMSDKHLIPDGSCEVTATMAVAGGLFSALISEEAFSKQTSGAKLSGLSFSDRMRELQQRLSKVGLISSAHASPIPVLKLESVDQLELAKKIQQALEAKGDKVGSFIVGRAIIDYIKVRDFTGIVIDASSVTGFKPAALPWIRGHKGNKLYPNADTPYEIVRANMPVSYDFNISDAINNKRVANKPLVIKAVSTYQSKNSDLVLDRAGQKKFIELMRKEYVNKNARIMIVVAD